MERTLFGEDHGLFRASVREFVKREIVPFHAQWEADGLVPRELWRKAGRAGLLCMAVPEEFGGSGVADFRYNVIVDEELARVGATGPGFAVHTGIVLPYLLAYGNVEQKRRWLPGMVSGETISAIGMTEPGAGSDLAALRTTAEPAGDHYLLNGSKTFITNGILADLVVVAARTSREEKPSRGISLLVVERGMKGFERGRKLEKIGMHAQDTAELSFDGVRIPRANLLGEEGKGFAYLMQNLVQERLGVAVSAVASCEAALETTVRYCQERKAFGQPIGSFQNSRFRLAEMKTEIEIGRVFVDRCIEVHDRGALRADEASMAKWWTTDLQNRVMDRCLQLHGGYGYMREYAIGRAFVDTRVAAIYAGTNEIMKELIGRAMGF